MIEIVLCILAVPIIAIIVGGLIGLVFGTAITVIDLVVEYWG